VEGFTRGITFGEDSPFLDMIDIQYSAQDNIIYRTMRSLTTEEEQNVAEYNDFCYRREHGLQTEEDRMTCWSGDHWGDKVVDTLNNAMLTVLGVRFVDKDGKGNVISKAGFW
jgi:hypothetical protein